MITTGVTTNAKLLLLRMLAEQECKVALYTSAADLNSDTTKYTTTGEASGKGYPAGGVTLKNPRVWQDRAAACLGWDSPVLPTASVTAVGFMIYDTSTLAAIFVGAWNGSYTSTEGPFTISIAPDQVCIE